MITSITDKYGREHSIPGPFPSIDHMKRANAEAGMFFFSKDTMRFFSSRIAPGVHAGRLFITSERCGFDNDTIRMYTIRLMADDGSTADVSGFLAYPTLTAARAAVKRILAGG